MNTLSFADKKSFCSLLQDWNKEFPDVFSREETEKILDLVKTTPEETGAYDLHDMPIAPLTLKTMLLFAHGVDADKNILTAIALYPFFSSGRLELETISKDWGDDVAYLITSLRQLSAFSHTGISAGYDNLRGLLVSISDDLRVLIILIVSNLALMREINLHPDDEWVRSIAFEAQYIYSQLAHKLGLYKIKGELEDLSLKYTNREIYKSIAHKLNETKRSRDAYIEAFIGPVSAKLTEAGLKFEIKGRTKSISSIWGKMKKQKTDVSGIRDLFAIRIILDSPGEKGKDDCWNTYSIVGNMYQTDEKRMRDWLSFPKSNGYESLHATVKGPGDKWVEVQIRTKEMDEVAEKGLAAHWRYKGGKGSDTDRWINNVREILETEGNGQMKLLKDARPDSFATEVYAFTPKGQLFKLPPNATVLDFAFLIHTKLGSQCTGARINGRHRKINHPIENGDTVEILSSPLQTPRQSWLDIVVTSKARTKIRQSLNEEKLKKASLGKEAFERRARNRKIEIDESMLNRLFKKEGYKFASDFFAAIEEGKVDIGKFLNRLNEMQEAAVSSESVKISAGEYRMHHDEEEISSSSPLLIDGKGIDGIQYKLSKCCNPVFGDKIFGFFSADGAIKIHKRECPNVKNIQRKYPERVVEVDWSGSTSNSYLANIRLTGHDDMGIINNVTSIVSKDMGVDMRNLRVDSNDGVFWATLTVSVKDTSQLSMLIKKLSGVKGVKEVERI